MNVDAVNAVPIVGGPFAYGIGFLVLVVVLVGGNAWGRQLATVAHEGGHWAVGALTFQRPERITLTDGGGGATTVRAGWSVGAILTLLAGYLTPSALGLGGATLIQHGKAWSVLWGAVVLLFGAFLKSGNALANVFVALALGAVGWAAFAGTPAVQAGVAVAVVWWLLIGGLHSCLNMGRDAKTDAGALSNYTWVPAIVWQAFWIFIAIICLWIGARRLLAL